MKTVCTVSRKYAAPVERVFAQLSDIENAAGRVPGILKIEMLTDGPVGVGTRFRETRKMFGKETTETMEFTAFEPNRMYEVGGASCGMDFRTQFHFTPDGGGTRVDVTMQTQAKTLFAKVMGACCGWMMKGTMKKCLQHDLDAMAAVVEAA